MCVDMHIDTRIGMCVDMRIDTRIGMCVDMRIDMSADVCTDMFIDMCTDMCIDMPMYTDMYIQSALCLRVLQAPTLLHHRTTILVIMPY